MRQASNVLKNPPTGFIENLKIISIIAKTYDTRILFINPPYRTLGKKQTIKAQTVNPAWEAVHEHCKAVQQIAELHACVFLNIAKDLPYPEDPYDFPAKYFFDPVHLNEAGAERFAEIVAEKIIHEKLL
jgi:lysophospholipase L1-like esterase